jgi:hypothetical protein
MPDFDLLPALVKLYLQLGGGVVLGWVLGRLLPKQVPAFLGKFLFWVGLPLGIIAFVRRADLSGAIWIAPVTAWVATFLGAGLAWTWLRRGGYSQANSAIASDESPPSWSKPAQGSFLLAAMVGNTGYLGFPITLALVGEKYFGWALFYDLLGNTPAAQALGVLLAAHFGGGRQSYGQLLQAMCRNPALWSLGFGLGFRLVPLPDAIDRGLQGVGWGAIALSLVLIGMRLSQLRSWHNLGNVSASLAIKMLLVPLVLGLVLLQLGVTGSPQLVIVLQMAMPPAFATLIIAEVYDLDRDLTVTALAVGSTGLLLTLPLWLLLFGS